MANNNLSSHSGASAAAAARMPSSSVMEVNTNNSNSNSNNNNNNNAADDDSVLDLAEQTQRPIDNALMQQRVNAWHPILDPVFVIVALFYFGVIMIPVGTLRFVWVVLFGVFELDYSKKKSSSHVCTVRGLEGLLRFARDNEGVEHFIDTVPCSYSFFGTMPSSLS